MGGQNDNILRVIPSERSDEESLYAKRLKVGDSSLRFGMTVGSGSE